jgi:squalene-associated FAD-dependent desaturase
MGFDAVVLGGGFAGLSAASALAEAGKKVVLLEKAPRLGGRARSFSHEGKMVDNGQHLFMGCYAETRKFLERVGSSHLLPLTRLRVPFRSPEGPDLLDCPEFLGAPANLALGVLKMRGLSLLDKLGLGRLKIAEDPSLDRMTVRQWFQGMGLSERVQARLLDPIAIGVLNDDPAVAAATGLVQAMSRMFYGSAKDSRLGLSSVGLSELYTEQAKAYVEGRGGEIRLSASAAKIEERSVTLENGEKIAAPWIVSTLPPWALKKLELPQALRGTWESLESSPIVSLYVWLDHDIVFEPITGLLGTDIHWVFKKENGALALVISGARKHVDLSPKELAELALRDLKRCFPAAQKATITEYKVVKEPFATLSPAPGSEERRPSAESAVPGFLFAGDWTRTGLPATIESAVASGHRAAEVINA